MNNHTDILDDIIKHDMKDLDVHFEKNFIDPLSQAEKNGDFPYVTFLLNDFTMQENSLRIVQNIDVYGFVKDTTDTLEYKRSKLLVDTATALKKRIKFNSGSISHAFSNFGLNAFLDNVYGAFRLSGVIGFHLEQLPETSITAQAANWLTLGGDRFTFLDGSEAQFIGGG